MHGLSGDTLAKLGEAIVRGEYPPGAVLRADELAGSLGVSRTVIREVVRVLEAMRLVSSRRRVGVTVRPEDEWDSYDPLVIRWRLSGAGRAAQLRSLTELRSAVEPMAARLAARRASAEQCGALVGFAVNLARTAKARDLEAFLGYDIEFHRLVLAASGNPMFAQLDGVVAEVLTGRTHHHLMPSEPQPAAVRWHGEVAEAINCAEPDRAERAMRSIATQALEEMNAQLGEEE